ncbi:hypothetical protein BDZ91DRAFT_741253 [Kalaharituber pfeilii]|nr:hypothetical protein BDZ91DRAFT_741253 [Kalaharituber pfeilii]
MLIRRPAARDKVYKLAKIDVSHFEFIETQRIKDKFYSHTPQNESNRQGKYEHNRKTPEFLVLRLVQANLRRRQQFIYSQSHNDKIIGVNKRSTVTTSHNIEVEAPGIARWDTYTSVAPSFAILSETTATTYIEPIRVTTATTYIEPIRVTTATTYIEPIRVKQAEEVSKTLLTAAQEADFSSGQSEVTSVARTCSENAQDPQYQIPPPPKAFADFSGKPRHFPCPYCFDIICPTNHRAWR